MEMSLYYKYLLHGAHPGRAVTAKGTWWLVHATVTPGPAGFRAGSACSDGAHHHGTLGKVLRVPSAPSGTEGLDG